MLAGCGAVGSSDVGLWDRGQQMLIKRIVVHTITKKRRRVRSITRHTVLPLSPVHRC